MNSQYNSQFLQSRRAILKSSTLALLPLAIHSTNSSRTSQQPMTANGGTDPYPIPWLDKFGSHNQAAGMSNEPGHIYHFKGRVVRTNNFTGMGTDNQGNRIAFGSPSTDYAIMQGDLGPPAPPSKEPSSTYDTPCSGDRGDPPMKSTIFTRPSPTADFSGPFPYPPAACGPAFSADGNSFTIEMHNVALIDQPGFPALDSLGTPAKMSFKLTGKSTGDPVKYEDASKHFRFNGTRVACQLEAQVEVPSIGFSWKSDPLTTSKSDFGIMGEEANGHYYDG